MMPLELRLLTAKFLSYLASSYSTMPKKKKKLTIQQFLIENFLADPKSVWFDNRKKGQQLRIATDLSKLYDRSFWEKLYLPFKLNSLAWFKSSKGKNFLKLEYKKLFLNLNTIEDVKLGRKVGRKKAFKKRKSKTILDFLRGDEEKS